MACCLCNTGRVRMVVVLHLGLFVNGFCSIVQPQGANAYFFFWARKLKKNEGENVERVVKVKVDDKNKGR